MASNKPTVRQGQARASCRAAESRDLVNELRINAPGKANTELEADPKTSAAKVGMIIANSAIAAISMKLRPSSQISAPMPPCWLARGGYMNQPASGAAPKKIDPQTNV